MQREDFNPQNYDRSSHEKIFSTISEAFKFLHFFDGRKCPSWCENIFNNNKKKCFNDNNKMNNFKNFEMESKFIFARFRTEIVTIHNISVRILMWATVP